MSKSLADQLLNKGLVDSKKAKAISKQKHQAIRQQQKKKSKSNNAQQQVKLSESEQKRRQQQERDRQLNLQRKQQADRKALIAQIVQLVDQYKLDRQSAEQEYNFNDGSVIKKILVTPSMSKELSRGRLCIVKTNSDYEIVPKPIADKISQRDKTAVIVCNDTRQEQARESDDDYYAQFEIPDDLIW